MTPEGKPFFAGTYIPKHTKYRIQGLMMLLPTLVRQVRYGSNLVDDKLKRVERRLEIARRTYDMPETKITTAMLNDAATGLLYEFDPAYGGFGGSLKFPRPHNMLYLFAHYRRNPNKDALTSATRTIDAIRNGGVYDHLGGGIHRYAVDRFWCVPHFEKMLYDQAQYAMACTDCWAVTGADRYRGMADDVFAYVLRDLTAKEGGFFSAEDADSEGEEGKFYLWTMAELSEVLSSEELQTAKKVFDLQAEGNWVDRATEEEQTTNVLRITPEGAALLQSSEETRTKMAVIRQKLVKVRAKRVRPGRDEKIMADWNGLMIASFARAGRVFGNSKYVDTAVRAFEFIDTRMRAKDGRLYHSWFEGKAGAAALLDDYVFMAWSAVELYRATYEPEYLVKAKEWMRTINEHFWDKESGGYYMTADDAEELLLRPQKYSDMAVPAGNSVALLVLTQLARLTGDHTLEDRAAKIQNLTARRLSRRLSSASQLAWAFEVRHTPAIEAVVVGDREAKDTMALLRLLENEALKRNMLILFKDASAAEPVVKVAPFVKAYSKVDGKAAAYICRGQSCSPPVTTPKDVEALLDTAP